MVRARNTHKKSRARRVERRGYLKNIRKNKGGKLHSLWYKEEIP
jgi:hypothetical protein